MLKLLGQDTTDYDQVIVTIYKVEFVNAADSSAVTVFDDPQGLTYDLSELSGVLDKLGTLPAVQTVHVLLKYPGQPMW